MEGTGALSPGTQAFQRGKALGLMAAGLAEMAGGVAGEVIGGLLTSTGIGATLGVPAIALSTVVVVGGAANVMAGVAGLMSSGSGLPNSREPSQGAEPKKAGTTARSSAGRAREFASGKLKEADFPDVAQRYLGSGYKEVSPGRYISADGLKQVRYGAHETNSSLHHAHFEAYDTPGGRIVENAAVELIP